MSSILSRDELRRLEKAAREKDKRKLADWIKAFEVQIDTMLRKDYEQQYFNEVQNSLDNALTAVAYTAYFSEESKVDKENIADYMADLFITLDMFRTGEYRPEEYADILKGEGITLDTYDCDAIYKKFLGIFDTELVKLLKSKYRKIATICGSSKFKDDILKVSEKLTLEGYIVLTEGLFEQADNLDIFDEERKQIEDMQKEKILLANLIYIVNKDGFIDDTLKSQIEYAKEHNKEIQYLEDITD